MLMWGQQFDKACEICKYLKSIIGDSVVTCDKVIDGAANLCNELTNFNEKKVNCKIENL